MIKGIWRRTVRLKVTKGKKEWNIYVHLQDIMNHNPPVDGDELLSLALGRRFDRNTACLAKAASK